MKSVITYDLEGKILTMNKGVEKLLDIHRKNLLIKKSVPVLTW